LRGVWMRSHSAPFGGIGTCPSISARNEGRLDERRKGKHKITDFT
jgi:hypothetical protein